MRNKSNAYIEIIPPKGRTERINLQFNPSEYRFSKGVEYKKTRSNKTNSDNIQLEEIDKGTLSFSTLFDTYMTLSREKKDVRESFSKLEEIIDIKDDKLNIPKLRLCYGKMKYTGYLNRLDVEYTMFSRTGVPVRAKLDIVMKLIDSKSSKTSKVSAIKKIENENIIKKQDAKKMLEVALNPRKRI